MSPRVERLLTAAAWGAVGVCAAVLGAYAGHPVRGLLVFAIFVAAGFYNVVLASSEQEVAELLSPDLPRAMAARAQVPVRCLIGLHQWKPVCRPVTRYLPPWHIAALGGMYHALQRAGYRPPPMPSFTYQALNQVGMVCCRCGKRVHG